VRRGVILVSLEPVRAIVTADRLYVLVPDGADGLLEPIRARLHKAARQRKDTKAKGGLAARHAGTRDPWDVAFEFAALEVIFMSAAAIKRREADETQKEAKQVLASVRKSLSSRRLSRVLRLKKRLAEVLNVVSGCRDAFQEVQEDEQMALMYLTALKANAAAFDERLRARSWNTDEVELLLDSYEQEMAAMMRRLKLLEQEIEATEALLKLQLDTARNNLIKVDVSFGVVALFFTACSVISGYYGMNLVNGHENDNDLVFGRSGPSTIWIQVVIISGGGALALIGATLATLWCCGLFQS
jgi:magnesium transporter